MDTTQFLQHLVQPFADLLEEELERRLVTKMSGFVEREIEKQVEVFVRDKLLEACKTAFDDCKDTLVSDVKSEVIEDLDYAEIADEVIQHLDIPELASQVQDELDVEELVKDAIRELSFSVSVD